MTEAPGWLVVNADDLGVSRGCTLGIIKAHREGIVTSASLAVTTPHYQFAVDECVRKCPDLGIGLHFTLTSGKPVSDPRRVPLLVNRDGYFRWRFSTLWWRVSQDSQTDLRNQIEDELDAQFAKLKRDGIQPDHVDGERHVQLIPGVFAMVVEAAQRYGVPFVRAARDIGPGILKPSHVPSLAGGGGFVKWGVLAGLSVMARARLLRVSTGSAEDIRSADHIASYLYTGQTGTFLPMVLSAQPHPGITELMVHPGIPGEDRGLTLGNRDVERYVTSLERQSELDACIAARGHTGAWQVTNFRTLAALAAQGDT